MSINRIGLISCIVTGLFMPISSKYVGGHLKTTGNWAFLTRFCFSSNNSYLEYHIEFKLNMGIPTLLLYGNDRGQWSDMYYNDYLTCDERVNVLKNEKPKRVIHLSPWDPYPYNEFSGCTAIYTGTDHIKAAMFEELLKLQKANTYSLSSPDFDQFKNETDEIIISCYAVDRFQSQRNEWRFIAISNCDSKKIGIDVKYNFLMTNGKPGDFWLEHFSADDIYMLPVLITFCLGYFFIVLAVTICTVELIKRKLLHTTYKVFIFSVFFQKIGILLQCHAYAKYAENGIGADRLRKFGEVLCMLSEILFITLLLLMAKGYTITRARLKNRFKIKLTVFITFYSLFGESMILFEEELFEPGAVLYMYQTPSGFTLLQMRVIACIGFGISIYYTIKKYPEKKVFYIVFLLVGILWFLTGPIFTMIAVFKLNNRVNESIVTALLLFVAFSGHVAFLVLTLPMFVNKIFPYHVRTTQICAMKRKDMIVNSMLDNFNHHSYQTNQNDEFIPSPNIPMNTWIIIPVNNPTYNKMDSNIPEMRGKF